MIQLAALLYIFVAFFAYVGWMRGWTKEIISLAGIILAIFALWEFRELITGVIFNDLPPGQTFYIQTALFGVIVFFAYETRGLAQRAGRRSNQEELQIKVLGAIVGGVNGYLISGTIWFFLDFPFRVPDATNATLTNYPIAPQVVAPITGSISDQMISNLPVYLLTGTSGEGTLLSLLVVGLFIIVLVLI